MRQSGQRTAGTNDIFNLRQVFALCQGLSSGRSIDIANLPRMAFDSSQNRLFRQAFYQLELILRLRDCHIRFQCFLQIDVQLLLTFLAQLFFADGFNDFHAVDVYAEVALYGSLCFRFRRGQNAGNRIGVLGYGVHIGSRTADIDDHTVADAVIQQLRTFHNRSRCRNDRTVYHVSDVLHARRLGDVVLEGLLNDLAARFDVQGVDLRIDIIDQIEFLSAFFIENQFHFILVFNIAGIHNRGMQSHIADHFCIIDCGIPFAVVHTTRDQDQIWVDFLDSRQIASSQSADRNIVNDAARAECRFSRRLGSHIINQSMDGHLQAACRGRGCQHFIIFQTVNVHLPTEIIDSSLQSDTNIAFQHRSRRLSLRPKNRIFAVKVFERIDNGRRRADLRN